MECFSVHFNVQTPLQIVFLNNLKIVGPLSKMKPCTKLLTFECSCWCAYEGIEKQMANNSWTI
jgi:hypothetical protein